MNYNTNWKIIGYVDNKKYKLIYEKKNDVYSGIYNTYQIWKSKNNKYILQIIGCEVDFEDNYFKINSKIYNDIINNRISVEDVYDLLNGRQYENNYKMTIII